MSTVLIISAVVSLMGILVWIALLVWAARMDGQDQARRDRSMSRET